MIDPDHIMSALDDAPAPLDLTIDPMALPELVMDLTPDDWPDFGLQHPFDPGAGYEESLGLYDLATACRDGRQHDWIDFFPGLVGILGNRSCQP